MNMKVTMILIVASAHGTILKNLEKRVGELVIRRRNDTIKTTALVKSITEYWRPEETSISVPKS